MVTRGKINRAKEVVNVPVTSKARATKAKAKAMPKKMKQKRRDLKHDTPREVQRYNRRK